MANDEYQAMLRRLWENATGGGGNIPPQSMNNIIPALAGSAQQGPSDAGVNTVSSGAVSGSVAPIEFTSLDQLARQLAELASVSRQQVDSTEANTRAVIENSLSQGGGVASTAGNVGKTVASFLFSGVGLAQLLGGLFGGDDAETVETLPRYIAPAPVNVEAGLSNSAQPAIQPLRYGQDGLPRGVQATSVPAAPVVNIHVDAIDSRSFLDHSAEIARAVKEALLNSHSLNDVVTEL